MTNYEIIIKISSLNEDIRNLYNRSQWASSSALDAFDDAVAAKEQQIKALYKELEKIEAK
jgi:hypothetical protein